MKFDKHFADFLSKVVNLNQTRLDNLNEKANNIRKFLASNLHGFIETTKQGSYALETIIKPVHKKQEYDVDILVFMKHEFEEPPSHYIDSLYDTLQTDKYKEKSSKGTRCVKLNYAEDFHMDLVPCIKKDRKYWICNYELEEFEMSDGTGYRDWFLAQNQSTNGNLKRVVRLLKFLRSHRNNFTAKSILLTTLAGNQTIGVSANQCLSIPDALLTISTKMRGYLRMHNQMPKIVNPTLPTETFNRHWDQNKYENFKEKFCNIADNIEEAYRESNNEQSLNKWKKLFGEHFGPSASNSAYAETNRSYGIFSTPPKPYLP